MYYSKAGDEGNGIRGPGAGIPGGTAGLSDRTADLSAEAAGLSGEAEERARLIDEIRGLEELKCAAAAAQARAAAAFDVSTRKAQARAGVKQEELGRGVAGQVALARRRLVLTGQVRHNRRPVGGALVSLVQPEGRNAAAVRADRHGNYELELPRPGTYVLTVVEPDGITTHTRRVLLPAPGTVIDVEIGGESPSTGLRI